MKVREVMAKTISTAGPGDTIAHAAELMKKEDCGFIPVVTGDEVVGVLTDRDIVIRCLASGHADTSTETIHHVMTEGAWTIDADAALEVAAHEMASHEVRRPLMARGRHSMRVGPSDPIVTVHSSPRSFRSTGSTA